MPAISIRDAAGTSQDVPPPANKSFIVIYMVFPPFSNDTKLYVPYCLTASLMTFAM